jgi:hypothetical protein
MEGDFAMRMNTLPELVARRYQELGAPVVSVMPAAKWDRTTRTSAKE